MEVIEALVCPAAPRIRSVIRPLLCRATFVPLLPFPAVWGVGRGVGGMEEGVGGVRVELGVIDSARQSKE